MDIKWFFRLAGYLEMERSGLGWGFLRPFGPQLLFQRRIFGFPNSVAGAGGMGGEGAMAKKKSITLYAKEEAARLFFRVGASVDDDSVTRMKWGEHFLEFDPVGSSPGYFSRKRTPLFSKASVNELLMVDAVEPT